MMQLRIFYLILIAIIFSCGSPTVSIDENNYQPKIVIEGYIYPDCPVSDIKISRNFPLNTTVNYDSAFISDALVTIEEVGGAAYNLTFEKGFRSYLDVDTNFTIESGKQYKLNVTATIDGKEFHASSITDVPQGTNFYIDEQQSVLDTMRFMEVDESGNLKNFSVTFSRAELVSIYMLSLIHI